MWLENELSFMAHNTRHVSESLFELSDSLQEGGLLPSEVGYPLELAKQILETAQAKLGNTIREINLNLDEIERLEAHSNVKQNYKLHR